MNDNKYELVRRGNDKNLINIDDIITNPEEYRFTIVGFDEGILYKKDDRIIKIMKTSVDNPLINDGFGRILINKDYFVNNPNKIDLLLKALCSNSNISTITINGLSLITDNLVDTIIANDSITSVFFHADKNSTEKIEMTRELFERFKKSKVTKSVATDTVSEELKDTYNPIISNNYNRKLIENCSFRDFETGSFFIFPTGIKPSELDNIKYITNGSKLVFIFQRNIDLESIMNKVIEYDKNFEIVIFVDDKEEFDKTKLFKDKKYEDLNIIIKVDMNDISLANYKKYESTLDSIVEPIQSDEYSPFEKFIYVYNITKRFKAYNEVPDKLDKELSRNVYDILNNEYMVCVGFASMLKTLLSRIGIENCFKNVNVKESNETDELEQSGHARVLVNIIDQKYGIDGYYVSDPTFDNSLEHDYYTFAAMDNEQALSGIPVMSNVKAIYVTQEFILELFESYTVDEFYQKINYYLNYVSRKNTEKGEDESNGFSDVKQLYKCIIIETMKVLNSLDSKKAKELMNKYKIKKKDMILSIDKDSDIEMLFKQFISEVANYVVEKSNRKILPSIIINAAMVINIKVLGINEEEAKKYRKSIVLDNIHRYDEYIRKQTEKNLPIAKEIERDQARFAELENEEITM